jgi:phage tail sheath protein FI
MAFQVSPGVLVQEKDLTNIIPAVSTSIGAYAINASRGPVSEVTLISSEQDFVSTFGKPTQSNFEEYFTASSFLQYSNALKVVRTENTGIKNAVTNSGTALLIRNTDHYSSTYLADGAYTGISGIEFAAKWAGAWGNGLKVSVCPSASAYETEAVTTVSDSAIALNDTTITVASGTNIGVGDIISFSSTAGTNDYDDGLEYEVTDVSSNDLTFKKKVGTGGLGTICPNGANVRRRWQYYDFVSGAPGTSPDVASAGRSNDELHLVVVDSDGSVNGTKGEVLEIYEKVSKAKDAKDAGGSNNFYAEVVFRKSSLVYWGDHNSNGTNWGDSKSAATSAYTDVTAPIALTFAGGVDGTATDGARKSAFEKFEDSETVDVGLIMAGNASASLIGDLITIAEKRKDCVVFASPERSDVVNITSSIVQTNNVLAFFNTIQSSSYIVFDSGYKYTYDRYNDVYRYVPLNGDMAGLCARTDLTNDPWFSPAGLNRGIIRGAVKLAYSPNKTQRDELYRARINPVVSFPGQGIILFGDKTGLTTPSAFDRINVRKLFIVLEKAIATASKFQLFEFNDEFTRAGFRNMVEPFLREVQGRRGITDFLVVCDESNNTGEVIDRNEFIAEIYIKPARSINFITLSFIATRTGVAFEEVAG